MTIGGDGPTIGLRARTPGDEAFLVELERARLPAELAAIGLAPPELWRMAEVQWRARTMAYQARFGTTHRVVVAGSRSVGAYLGVAAAEHRIVDIAIVPSHRRCGIGTALVSHAIEEARRAGVALQLTADAGDGRLLGWYERFGFRPVGGDELQVYLELLP
ncbi:MAG: GNAT family N-acetyltransferase [Acidimicrobiia bacterium]